MKLLLLVAAAATSFCASPKEILGSSHGSFMSVSYRALDSGKHVLVVLRRDAKKVTEVQSVELNLKKDEFLSEFYSFRCNQQIAG